MYKINYTDSKLNKLWNEYAEKRNIGLKKDANKLLDNVIKYIDNLESVKKEKFVYYLCNLKFEEEIDITFQ